MNYKDVYERNIIKHSCKSIVQLSTIIFVFLKEKYSLCGYLGKIIVNAELKEIKILLIGKKSSQLSF